MRTFIEGQVKAKTYNEAHTKVLAKIKEEGYRVLSYLELRGEARYVYGGINGEVRAFVGWNWTYKAEVEKER